VSTIREALHAIYAEHGAVTPVLVLEAAQDEASPLHSHFTWDDTEAAEQWRIQQARSLIRKVKIRVIDQSSDTIIKVRAYTSVPTSEGRRYMDTSEVVADAHLSTLVRDELMNELRVLREKLRRFDEFAAIVAAIDQVAA
jgi:hypothetical protein